MAVFFASFFIFLPICLACFIISDHSKLQEKSLYLIVDSCPSGIKYRVKIKNWAIKDANGLGYETQLIPFLSMVGAVSQLTRDLGLSS